MGQKADSGLHQKEREQTFRRCWGGYCWTRTGADLEYPSCLHAESPSELFQLSAQTVLHSPRLWTCRTDLLPLSRTDVNRELASVLLQHSASLRSGSESHHSPARPPGWDSPPPRHSGPRRRRTSVKNHSGTDPRSSAPLQDTEHTGEL